MIHCHQRITRLTKESPKRVASVLHIEVEEICKKSRLLVGILASTGPSRVAFLINQAIQELIRTPWQIPSYDKMGREEILFPLEGF